MRVARTKPQPRSISRDVPNGKASADRSASVQGLQQPAGVRPHHRDHRQGLADVGDGGELVRADMPFQPVAVAGQGGGAGQHQEPGLVQPGDGDVGLDPAMRVEPLGVDDAARLDRQVARADPLQHGFRVPALHQELAERGGVEHADGVPDGAVLGRRVLEPVLAAERVLVLALDARGGVPVGALPAQQLAEHRPGGRNPVVQRAAAQPADAGALLVGPVDLVREVQGLGDALLEETPVGLVRGDPAGIGLGQVERRAPVHDPVGQDRAGPGAGQEADRVEPGGDEAVAQPGGLAEVVEAVRGEALRPAEMQPDTGVGQHRQPLHHVLVERPEVVPVLGQAGELRVGGDAARGPGIAARLEEADHEPGALVPHVRVVRGGLDRRQAGRKAGDRLGDDVVVRERLERDADAGQRAELASPHAGGGHHVLGLDVPVLGGDAGDPPVAAGDPGHLRVLDDPHAVLAGARGQGHGGVGGVAPPVVRVVHRPGEVPGVQRREQLDRLLRGDRPRR